MFRFQDYKLSYSDSECHGYVPMLSVTILVSFKISDGGDIDASLYDSDRDKLELENKDHYCSLDGFLIGGCQISSRSQTTLRDLQLFHLMNR
jgi:hypothetical protein